MKKYLKIFFTLCICLLLVSCSGKGIVSKEVVFYNGENGFYLEAGIPEFTPLSMQQNTANIGCWSDIITSDDRNKNTLYAFEVGLRKNQINANLEKNDEEIEKVKAAFLEEGFYIFEKHNYVYENNDFVIVGTMNDFLRIFSLEANTKTISGWSCWANPASRPDWNDISDEEKNKDGQSVTIKVDLIAP
ncbi:MAG: hypothetical protein ACI4TK_07935 [Agathobacter sp.]